MKTTLNLLALILSGAVLSSPALAQVTPRPDQTAPMGSPGTPAPGAPTPAVPGPTVEPGHPVVTAPPTTAAPILPPEAAPTEDFVILAMAGNLFEIQLSQALLERSTNEAVRTLADRMIADHGLVASFLAIVTEAGTEENGAPPQLPADKQSQIDQLRAATAEEIDALYLQSQLAAHQEAVALYTAYAAGGDDDAMRTFAGLILPALTGHLAMIEGVGMAHAGDPAAVGATPAGENPTPAAPTP